MKQKITLFITTALLLQTIVFSQTNPLVRYLPDDISMVMNIDLKRMGDKIPAEKFRQSFIYRELMKDPQLTAFFSSPGKAGIDLSAGILFAIKNESIDGRPNPVIQIFGKLSDAQLFTTSIKALAKEGASIDTYGTDRIISTEGKMTMGWNNDVFVITSGNNAEIRREMEKSYSDTTATETFDLKNALEKLKKSQRDLCFRLLAPATQNSFSGNMAFLNVMNSEADIKTWNGGTANPMTGMGKDIPFAGLLEKLQALSGKNKTSLINFEKGKIVMQTRNFPEGEMKALYQKYTPVSSGTELLRHLPAGKLIAFMNMSFNEEMNHELLQKTGLMELIDSFKKEIPFDISLMNGVFKASALLAVVKTDPANTIDAVTTKMGGFQLFIAMPIADKAKFQKLKPAALFAWNLLKNSKKDLFKEASFFASTNDELLVLSLSPESAKAFLNNTGNSEFPGWLTAYSNYPMLMNINFREIMEMVMGKSSPQKNIGLYEKKLLNTFDQFIVYGGDYANESINSTAEFRFSDQTENALSQLFDLMAGMAEGRKNILSENNPTWNGTTTTVDSVTLEEIRKEEYREPPPPPPPAKLPRGVKMTPAKKTKQY